MNKFLIVIILISIFLFSRCSYPLVEGSMENCNLIDALLYSYKIIFGPISREYNEQVPDFGSKVKSYDLTIIIFGDIMFYESIINKDKLYNEIPEALIQSNITLANLEFPIHNEKPISAFPRFNGSTEYFEEIVLPLNPTIINVANNHCLDKGMDGFLKTTSLLESYGIETIGYEKKEKRYIVYQVKDIKIAFSGYTFSTNNRITPGDEIINIAHLNATELSKIEFSEIETVIEKMNKDSDIIVFNLHWGLEYELTPTKNQVKIARKLCDEGVDIIIGHHPHVLQPIELYQNKRGTNSLIIYSTGNWTTAMRKKCCRISAPLKLFISKQGEIIDINTYPFFFNRRKLKFERISDSSKLPSSISSFAVW